MPAQLVGLDDGIRILLDKPILLLGRDAECDIQFDSRKVSRRHCCIAQVGTQLIVRDLGSTNGIRINGTRVLEGYLKSGDELTVGNHRYQIHWGDIMLRAKPVEENKNPQIPPKKPVAVKDADDEVLENCDEPIPLAEPILLVKEIPIQPLPDFKPSSLPVLPDELELAPSSDSFPPPPVAPAT
jgi:pSer/pThr/pTyr-binding forkhead associated (FHA) protein